MRQNPTSTQLPCSPLRLLLRHWTSAGAHPGMECACNVLRFPEPADPDVVYVQYRLGSIYLEDRDQI
ncbi:Scr1 family TA system antitoxin-like transcriptional regulator [Spirillospora sp. NPDC077959]|uniref:Scr1 family TA system antitoxin-like transcriptional regulator n=1 Tax=Spirillospora sp. NPDC077959 TaxID=3364529 RepID=UPI0037D89378